jgi:hypothetical protein
MVSSDPRSRVSTESDLSNHKGERRFPLRFRWGPVQYRETLVSTILPVTE